MIISKTPFRISFFGGGSDYPGWYEKHGGAVLSTTIDKYCYITCRRLPPFFPNKHRIVWSHIESVASTAEILHPAVREGIRFLGMENGRGLEIHHQGDLPARSGMGSSSSFAVGLINALTALKGNMIDKHDLALKAIELEQHRLRENVGSQDQVAAAHGGFNHIRFLPGGEISVSPVIMPAERLDELQAHLMLFYTGTSRLSSEIAANLVTTLEQQDRPIRRMHAMVTEALSILDGGAMEDFGALLHEAWQAKRGLHESISNPVIDRIYETARRHGALGGKLLGAGASGFMLFFVPPREQEAVREALAAYLNVPFSFEHRGSAIIYYTPDESPRQAS